MQCRFDVLRIIVLPSDDDDVLDATGDEQLTIFDEPKVACAKERSLAGVGQVSLKGLASLFDAIVVPSCYAWPGYPDLSDAVGRAKSR